MKHYVVGFVISPDGNRVLLLQKNRPAHMAGFWCGVGGKVEPGETPAQAMDREGREEAALEVAWSQFITLRYDDRFLHFFAARSSSALRHVRQMTDERIAVFDDITLRLAKLVPNCRFLIPMAIHHVCQEPIEPATMRVRASGIVSQEVIG